MQLWRWHRLSLVLVVAAAAGVALEAPAYAQLPQQADQCVNNRIEKFKFSPDAAIAGCTAAIQSGQWSGAKLAWAYANRCREHNDKAESDQAIEDCNQALALNPRDSAAFNNRGNAYYGKKDYARAIADYDQAIQLQPKFATALDNRGIAYAEQSKNDGAIAGDNRADRLGIGRGLETRVRGSTEPYEMELPPRFKWLEGLHSGQCQEIWDELFKRWQDKDYDALLLSFPGPIPALSPSDPDWRNYFLPLLMFGT